MGCRGSASLRCIRQVMTKTCFKCCAEATDPISCLALLDLDSKETAQGLLSWLHLPTQSTEEQKKVPEQSWNWYFCQIPQHCRFVHGSQTWSDVDLSQAWAAALLSTWANRPSWNNSGKEESIPLQFYLISKEEWPLFAAVTSDVWCVAAVYPEEQSILLLLCPSYLPRNKLSLSTKKMYGLLSVLDWWSRGCQQEPLHEAVEAQRQFSAL